MKLTKDSKVLANAELRQWLESFLGSSSKDLGLKLENYFREIKARRRWFIRHPG